jgi:integrase
VRRERAADLEGGPAGALVKLLILTGARRNEITELSRDEIKAEAIELPSERTKNGIPHTIPLTPIMCRVLETLPRSGKFVLNGKD